MSLFLVSYLAIYGGMHAYLLIRTVRSFGLGALWSAFLAVFCAFMVVAPLVVRLLHRHGAEGPARVVAYAGYFWMGAFFLGFSASVVLDLARGVLWLAGLALHGGFFFLADGRVLILSALFAVTASVYGFFEARNVLVERVTIHSPKLPRPVRLVQLSDVHLGLVVGRQRLAGIVAKVKALQPDLLVSTGDLVDGQVDGLQGLDEVLGEVRAPLGKFAVTGNHEALAGLAASAGFIRRCGFTLLRGDAAHVEKILAVAGVDDPFVRDQAQVSEEALLGQLPKGRFVLLLKHRPALNHASLGHFDLQLSGHVHKGQIFPFNLVTHLFYPVKMGLSGTPSGERLYVSRGTGTWGPPIRFLAPPEITVIDLVPGNGDCQPCGG